MKDYTDKEKMMRSEGKRKGMELQMIMSGKDEKTGRGKL
jgi:hypothetical protein